MKHATYVTFFLIIVVSIVAGDSLSPAAAAQADDTLTYLPIVERPVTPPELNAIDNSDWDNTYTVSWTPSGVDYYVLEESQSATFSDSTVVYQGSVSAWTVPAPGKYPGTYYYRVKAFSNGKASNWSNVRAVLINPLFVGLDLRWDGVGYLNIGPYYEPGWHLTRYLDGVTSPGVGRFRNHQWYNPDPRDFGEAYWESFYELATGRFLSSSVPNNPAWKWGNPWIVPYEVDFHNGQTIDVGGQPFLVTGPHQGFTTFGQPVQYWELTNQDRFLFFDNGGEWTQYVHAGDATLRYDAGASRLLIYRNILRRYYQDGDLSEYTVQYISNLTEADSFPGGSANLSNDDGGASGTDNDEPDSPPLPATGPVPLSVVTPSMSSGK